MISKRSFASVLFPILVSAGCEEAKSAESVPPPEAEVVPVRIAAVTSEPLVRSVHGVGRVRATTEVALSFPFAGVVQDVRVVAGQRVHKGQILAVLDDAAAQAQLSVAQSALAKAARDTDRASALEGKAVGRQQVEDAGTGLAVARANVDAASFQARRQSIVAPADGVIVAVNVDEQGTVGAGMPAILFAGGDAFEVELTLAAVDAVGVVVGDPADVYVDALPDAVFHGRVTERAGGAGLFGGWHVTVGLEPDAPGLASGLVAAVDVTPTAATWTTVPLDALAEADGETGAVYAINPDATVRRVPVAVAFVEGDRVAVKSGLDGVGTVVTAGLPWLSEGAKVRVVGGGK